MRDARCRLLNSHSLQREEKMKSIHQMFGFWNHYNSNHYRAHHDINQIAMNGRNCSKQWQHYGMKPRQGKTKRKRKISKRQ